MNEENERTYLHNQRLGQMGSAFQSYENQAGLGPYANPYSTAASLERNRDTGFRRNLNSAGLQLYSGSTVNRRGYVQGAYDRNLKSLEAEEAARRAEYERERDNENAAYQAALSTAQAGAIERAESSEPEPVAPPTRGRGVGGRRRGRGRGRGR